MANKQNHPTPLTETKENDQGEGLKSAEPEAPKKATAKSKYFDVFDTKGNLINIYEDEATADVVAGKEEGRTVKPSPAERTRADVKDAALKLRAARKKQLEESNPGHYTP